MSSLAETRKIVVACLVTVLGLPTVGLADQTATGKGVSASDTVEKRATITSIDPATRTVTLKGEKDEFAVQVGPEVTNFDQLKVGDAVVAAYTESIAVRIAAPGEATPGVTGSVSATPSDKGSPKVGHEVTASLKVEAVDLAANTVTLSGASGEKRTVEVKDPKVRERLKTVKPGDVVVVTYTESLAMRLEKVGAK
jgi:hypothetical protein